MIPSVTVNGITFPVLYIHDVSMTEEAQREYDITVKDWRVETRLSDVNSITVTPDVCMVAFISSDVMDLKETIVAPVMLIEKMVGGVKSLEAYDCLGDGGSRRTDFVHELNGFLGCTQFLNLGFYLLEKIAGLKTRSLSMIYFVDRQYLNNRPDDEPPDMSLDEFFQSPGPVF